MSLPKKMTFWQKVKKLQIWNFKLEISILLHFRRLTKKSTISLTWWNSGLTLLTLREKCLYLELFWSVFYRIQTKHREIRRISTVFHTFRLQTAISVSKHLTGLTKEFRYLKLINSQFKGSTSLNRSSLQGVFCKNGVLKNFVKFPGKHLCQVSCSFRAATLLKKRLRHSFFSANFVKILKTHFYSAPLVAASTKQMYQNQTWNSTR